MISGVLKKNLILCLAVAFSSIACASPQTDHNPAVTGDICSKAVSLQTPSDLDPLIEICAGSRLVLLGESTHGTAEFYHWRAEISKRLITEQGFDFIAVEGDWAALYRLNLYVKGLQKDSLITAVDILGGFDRWPEWMWGNTIIADLAEWLKVFNSSRPQEKRIGIYGMDVYGQWDAMDEVIRIAGELIPEHTEQIIQLYSCYTAFNRDEWEYAKAVLQGRASCDDNLSRVVDIFKRQLQETTCPDSTKALRHAKQSAVVVKNSEDFFRLAVRSNTTSWNSRALHMHESVTRLLEIHGEESKGIVWAHNTHIGDARATNMAGDGRFNIGQLSRIKYGRENTTSIGFTTYTGQVNAGARWGAEMSVMRIPRAREGSIEDILNNCNNESFFVIMDEEIRNIPELRAQIGHRAIGVVYDPSTERLYNYVPTVLPRRYDAIIFIRNTSHLEVVE